MKTQTAEEYLRKKVRLIGDKGTLKINQLSFILNNYTTTQIESLRERLVESALSGHDKFRINQTINNFLKEINDGK
jgi:hypothetical protein